MGKRTSLFDRPDSYGWISIFLHWTTAVIIIAMWFIGKSIADQGGVPEVDARRSLHVTLGLWTGLLLASRIIWRFKVHHPHAVGQSHFIHRVARAVHYMLLSVVLIMLMTGPVIAWALPEQHSIADAFLAVHSMMANATFILVVIHIFGALKHLMFHEDETIARMLWPKPNKATRNKQIDT